MLIYYKKRNKHSRNHALFLLKTLGYAMPSLQSFASVKCYLGVRKRNCVLRKTVGLSNVNFIEQEVKFRSIILNNTHLLPGTNIVGFSWFKPITSCPT